MELSWQMKLRIAASFAVGVILLSILAWPMVSPPTPFDPISFLDGTINNSESLILFALALSAGFIAYFLAWPYGSEIGILAVPAGLSVLAVRTGSMANLLQANPALAQREVIFAALKWESLFWLALVGAGFLGTFLAAKIARTPANPSAQPKKTNPMNAYINIAIALVASGLIAQICLNIFAQDVRLFDSKLGSVIAQPAIGQIVFAVFVSFGIAAFVAKLFLDAGYIWPIIATAIVPAFAISVYLKQGVLQYLFEHWPPVFFTNSALAILPIQMVSFGTLGAVAGFWMAIRYQYWRKHEI